MGNKLTRKTFLLLTALSLITCLTAYGCIWIFLPDAGYAADRLEQETNQLVRTLWSSEKENSGELFLDFIRRTGTKLALEDVHGQPVSIFQLQKHQADTDRENGGTFSQESSEQEIRRPFRFADAEEEYLLIVRYDASRSQEMSAALFRSMPYVATAAMLLSLSSAWLFSRYTTRPILRIHKIAEKMARLDFSWYCPDVRDDEIGMLSKSINELSDRLHEALRELHRRNATLQDEIRMEKEQERKRMLFISGISHELKTPLAIVIGQLEGMQAGIGVYKDRDKYLARSAEILQSLDHFLKEILFVSHIDLADPGKENKVCLSALTEDLLTEYTEYAEFSDIVLQGNTESGLYVYGEALLLKKALGNILGNAVSHSPAHAVVTVKLSGSGGSVLLTVDNAPAHIEQKHLAHLFEAFYRADASAEHGSGLGLYIAKLVFETCHVSYKIENTDQGVRFTAVFARTYAEELF